MISPEIKAALDAVAKAKETAQVVSGYAQAYGITKGQPAKIMQSSLQGLSSS